MDNKFIKIRLAWSYATIDPQQYKPTSPCFIPQDVYIEVEVPNKPEYVIETTEKQPNNGKGIQVTDIFTVLTAKGMAYVCKKIAFEQAKLAQDEHWDKA